MNVFAYLSVIGFLVATAEAANLQRAICGPVCMIYCPYGNIMDDRGCPTCRCHFEPVINQNITEPVLHSCPGVLCDIYCPNGNELDQHGCPMCACKSGPLDLLVSH
ncbi:hypothetical protein CHS0354_000057 [Potamilus streckersoni]|uniref:Antistasin-like domain-containing protein n=1 Tax=Potamilus streckersoni TaxID=2493646 RepID=A0AAE0VK06_9BIVA|nr:hypothetical protein CHS0354_000057 [Potamilus streckersoni]